VSLLERGSTFGSVFTDRAPSVDLLLSSVEVDMEAIVERCCGLDVHQETVVACVIRGVPGRRPTKEVRTFGTVTRGLLALRQWLEAEQVTHVGMESTGVYWIPVFRILEGGFELVIGNAHHIKNVPGRKTDVKDSEWIADLVRHGLIRPSFVPPPPIRELRELTRYRRKLVDDLTRERNRIQKLLETACIKLASVMSDVLGASGRAMLTALVEGQRDPETLAQLAKGSLRRKIPLLIEALDGRFEPHHQFLLAFELRRLADGERSLAALDAHIDTKLVPYQRELALLVQIPGIERLTAAAIIAELGVDMSVFPSAAHAAAWAGASPGNNESAGKHHRAPARKGNVHLLTALVQAAAGATHKRGSYLREKFWRLKVRRGSKRALVAIAHKILVAIYHMLRDDRPYVDLGEDYLKRHAGPAQKRHLVRQLERMGFEVTLAPAPT
jgi:transposase